MRRDERLPSDVLTLPFFCSISIFQIYFCVRNTKKINATARPAAKNGNVTSTQPVPKRMIAVFTRTKNMRASVGPILSTDIRNSLVAANDKNMFTMNAPPRAIRAKNQYHGMLLKIRA